MAPPPKTPTDAEWPILEVLWARGPSTVREVHDALESAEGRAYTTTLKLMQIMHDKGLLDRDASQRSHVYAARLTKEGAQRSMVSALAAKAFDGSASALVLRALGTEKTSKKELSAIRAMLDELEKGGRS
ncbi:MAG: BlaI/MecI/CopY family transcriptional regulator [Polyangiaceae bacterium]